jgi:hypothetical protein
MDRVKVKLRSRQEQTIRKAANSPLKQGSNETVTYYVDFAEWGASVDNIVSSPVVTILDDDDTDVTSTLCAAGGSVVASVEVEFTITEVVVGAYYRVFVRGTSNSRIEECWFHLQGEL